MTFRPKDAGKVVKLTFKSFSTSYNDNFYIYYGGKKTSTPDVKVSKMLEAPVVSVADDGKLTVYFKCPSYSYASNGWAIEVSQYELLPLSVGNMAITSVAAGESLRGSKMCLCSAPKPQSTATRARWTSQNLSFLPTVQPKAP